MAHRDNNLKFREKLARTGAKNERRMVPAVPAINEPMAAMKRASPALPFLAIWNPSTHVGTEADSPGTFKRILVVEPPYMAP